MIEQHNPPTRGEKLITYAANTISTIDYAFRLGMFNAHSPGGIRPQMIDGELHTVVHSNARISADPQQPPQDWHNGMDNKYYKMFKELKQHYAEQGVDLKVIGPKQFAEMGIEMPSMNLSFFGKGTLCDHHRLWAILSSDLGLGIAVNTYRGRPISYN